MHLHYLFNVLEDKNIWDLADIEQSLALQVKYTSSCVYKLNKIDITFTNISTQKICPSGWQNIRTHKGMGCQTLCPLRPCQYAKDCKMVGGGGGGGIHFEQLTNEFERLQAINGKVNNKEYNTR